MSDKSRQPDSDVEDLTEDSFAQATRRKYLYRKLVMNGQAKLPARLAMKLVGPDCAFHLYHSHRPDRDQNPKTA